MPADQFPEYQDCAEDQERCGIFEVDPEDTVCLPAEKDGKKTYDEDKCKDNMYASDGLKGTVSGFGGSKVAAAE